MFDKKWLRNLTKSQRTTHQFPKEKRGYKRDTMKCSTKKKKQVLYRKG